ncbi:MAG: threonine ammonia-lyase [Anaerovoracaceae bacterium]|nr:threonine ammonia-lyase [Anaerovoracaceae bacterium]
MSELLTMEMVKQARERLDGVARRTMQPLSPAASRRAGCNVYFKLENQQRTGSFKLRGAYNMISGLSDEEKARGLIAASAGNHAQGVALAAKEFGAKAVICMPEAAPKTKIERTRAYGPEIVLKGQFVDDALAEARRLEKEHGYTFVHSCDDPLVMAGDATIGCEILDELPDTDMIVVQVGGGGLIAGIAYAAKHIKPDIKIIGVESSRLPSMKKSLEAGKILTVDGTQGLADGIMARAPGDNTFGLVQKYVDDVVTVDDDEVADAMRLLIEDIKTVPEGAGACTGAALLNGKISLDGVKNVVALVSGGNVDMSTLADVIEEKI